LDEGVKKVLELALIAHLDAFKEWCNGYPSAHSCFTQYCGLTVNLNNFEGVEPTPEIKYALLM
jgi:hypothetical protein